MNFDDNVSVSSTDSRLLRQAELEELRKKRLARNNRKNLANADMPKSLIPHSWKEKQKESALESRKRLGEAKEFLNSYKNVIVSDADDISVDSKGSHGSVQSLEYFRRQQKAQMKELVRNQSNTRKELNTYRTKALGLERFHIQQKARENELKKRRDDALQRLHSYKGVIARTSKKVDDHEGGHPSQNGDNASTDNDPDQDDDVESLDSSSPKSVSETINELNNAFSESKDNTCTGTNTHRQLKDSEKENEEPPNSTTHQISQALRQQDTEKTPRKTNSHRRLSRTEILDEKKIDIDAVSNDFNTVKIETAQYSTSYDESKYLSSNVVGTEAHPNKSTSPKNVRTEKKVQLMKQPEVVASVTTTDVQLQVRDGFVPLVRVDSEITMDTCLRSDAQSTSQGGTQNERKSLSELRAEIAASKKVETHKSEMHEIEEEPQNTLPQQLKNNLEDESYSETTKCDYEMIPHQISDSSPKYDNPDIFKANIDRKKEEEEILFEDFPSRNKDSCENSHSSEEQNKKQNWFQKLLNHKKNKVHVQPDIGDEKEKFVSCNFDSMEGDQGNNKCQCIVLGTLLSTSGVGLIVTILLIL